MLFNWAPLKEKTGALDQPLCPTHPLHSEYLVFIFKQTSYGHSDKVKNLIFTRVKILKAVITAETLQVFPQVHT